MEEISDDKKIKLSASIKGKDRQKFIEEIKDHGLDERNFHRDLIQAAELGSGMLDDREKLIIDNLLVRAADKMAECGIPIPKLLLPGYDDFIIRLAPKGTTRSVSSRRGNYIVVSHDNSSEFGDVRTQFSMFHELAHFVARKVFARSKDKSKLASLISHGFTRIQDLSLVGEVVKGGIWEESLADIFTFYAADSDYERVVNRHETAFMIALIDKYALLKQKEPLDVFREFFRAKTMSDFSLQRELADVFGKELVKRVNNLVLPKDGYNEEYIKEVGDIAKLGGFFDIFDKIQNEFENGNSVSVSDYIPGVKGKMISNWVRKGLEM